MNIIYMSCTLQIIKEFKQTVNHNSYDNILLSICYMFRLK
jgi:hypothetical protein